MRKEVNGRVSKVARRPTPSMQPSWSKLETLQRDTSKVSVRPNAILHSSRPTTTTSKFQLSPPFCRHRGRPSASDVTSGERTGTDVTEPAGSSSRCRRSGCQASAAADAWSAVRRGACNRGTAADCVWPMEEDQGANSSAASGGGVVTQTITFRQACSYRRNP